MSQIVENALSFKVEGPFKKFLDTDADPEGDEFQNVICSFSSNDTSLAKFSRIFDQ